MLIAMAFLCIVACTPSPQRKLIQTVEMVQCGLPKNFGHGLMITDIGMDGNSLCLTVLRDSTNCYLSDSTLCSESFILRMLMGDNGFYDILKKVGADVRVLYITNNDTLTSVLVPDRIREIALGVGVKPMGILDITRNELTNLHFQLPRMEDESLCLYDAFVDDKAVTFVYIYPDEVVKDMPDLSEDEILMMKNNHIVGLQESYSMADMESFYNERAIFVYKYITETKNLCTVVIEASELLPISDIKR